MRIAVIGAGAMGAVVALAAAETGHDVVVCVRTPIDSLEVQRRDGSSKVRATFIQSPVGPAADVVFLAVKITDTPSAAPFLSALCGPTTLTVAVQNGLDHAARVAPFLPADAGPVAAALAYMAAHQLGPGLVRHDAGSLLVVPDAHSAAVSEALAAGIKVRGTDDIVTATWRKLLTNLVANPLTALTLRRMDVMASPGMSELGRALLAEAVAVGRADGADLDDSQIDRIMENNRRLHPDTGSSMLYDRLAGRPMEHQYLTGEIVRRAATHGIAVPVHSTLLALLEAVDQRRPEPA